MVGRSLALAVAFAAAVPLAGRADELSGVWSGQYVCAQGSTGLTLTIAPPSTPNPRALFRFYAIAANPHVPDGCFSMNVVPGAGAAHVNLGAEKWIVQPPNYVMVDLAATLDGNFLTGNVAGPGCVSFALHRVDRPAATGPAACLGADLVASR